MTPQELKTYLEKLVAKRVTLSTMLWGPPGVGKSSLVAQVASAAGIGNIDVRLSQLAPTDLRGLPVPDGHVSRWLPPEFLPTDGEGILFLDELNMAPPVMQGIAQQLILDRKVGSYTVPSGWFVWAAGNRKEDRASVFDMPAPLANRFLHLTVEPDLDSFKAYALNKGISDRLIAFLAFRPTLLHKLDPHQPSWPSPRSWEMASQLLSADLNISAAVGEGAAAEFWAFEKVYANLPSLETILEGKGATIKFPSEPSARYATVIGLTSRAPLGNDDVVVGERVYNSIIWLLDKAEPEWFAFYAKDLFGLLRSRGQMGAAAVLAKKDPKVWQAVFEHQKAYAS
ncbi:MAG: MoxR family ATPase [Armatimonas sp.]